jgi:hypothetical protein
MREAQLVWELAENLHRLDLTKDQRDQHIRRYAELLEARADQIPVQQNAAVEIGYGKPPPRPKGIPRQIAELLEARAARTDCPTSLADGRGHRPKSVATEIAEANAFHRCGRKPWRVGPGLGSP